MRTLLFSLPLLFSLGCNKETAEEPVTLEWKNAQEWHLATNYRIASVKEERIPVDLEDGSLTTSWDSFWSQDVVWTYQVVENNMTPKKGDELYRFAKKKHGDGVAELTVIKGFLDPQLNTHEGMVEADPVVYLVFRSKRNRLAGIVSFVNVDGERIERAWSSQKLNRAHNTLSQSMLSYAPTYLAPHGVTVSNGEKRLENGSFMSTATVKGEANTVDVVYDDELGGGTVASRYKKGQPWPTWTVGENVESRMLSADEVDSLRVDIAGNAPLPPPAEDFDFRAALASSLNLDVATVLDEDTIANGWDAGAADGYKPWNGWWWPQKEAAFVFGYDDNRETISDMLLDTVKPIKSDMDRLSDDFRDMEDGEEKDKKIQEYRDKQSELIDELVKFYNGVRDDLDGGNIKVEAGKITHLDDGWSYELDELSPFDKFALQMWARGGNSSNPFYLPASEILNGYSPAASGNGWWGHCNGWAAAAILTNEPTDALTVPLTDDQDITYSTADLKGLQSEAHYSTYSRFYGKRYYKDGDEIEDLTPPAFHRIISFYFKEQGVPVVFDTDAEEQVWNFPAYHADVDITETTVGQNPNLVNINTAGIVELDTLPGIGEAYAGRIIEYRETYGPFQTKEDVIKVRGIGSTTFNKMSDLITVVTAPQERTFDVVARTYFATDGVDAEHVDPNGDPSGRGFVNTYKYELVTDIDGVVLRGTWDDPKKHPDFAWVPYSNPRTVNFQGSENPYLPYGTLVDVIGEEWERQ